MITTITGTNRVAVPAAIAAAASLRPGTRLDWELAEEGVLLVRILPDRARLASGLRGRRREHRRRSGSAVARLIGERGREVAS